MPSHKKQIALILLCAALNSCAQYQSTLDDSTKMTSNIKSATCPTKDNIRYDYIHAREILQRLSDKLRDKTILNHRPGISVALDKKLLSIYSRALKKDPCIEGTIHWIAVLNNDGKIAEIQQLSSSIDNPPLEFELSKALSNLRFPPIAAPKNSVYLLPITFRVDSTHTPSLDTQEFFNR